MATQKQMAACRRNLKLMQKHNAKHRSKKQHAATIANQKRMTEVNKARYLAKRKEGSK